MSITFVVKFLNLSEQTKDEFEYSKLLDALKVAKETAIDGTNAMSDEQFNEELIILLTSGFIYAGKKSSEYPDGKYMVQLLRRLENDIEEPVYGPRIVPFVAGLIPQQRDESTRRMSTTRIGIIPPVANDSRDENIIRGED